MLKKLIFCSVFLILISCVEEDQTEKEIAQIPVELEVTRFDERFAMATEDSLENLKKEFPYLFPKRFPDSVWVEKMTDTIQLELNEAVASEFPDLKDTREELERLFQHIKYYFPASELPEVVTLTSDVDYRNQVIWTNEVLLIALDTYLGEDHELYVGIEQYISKNLNKGQIVVDVAGAFAETELKRPSSRSFLASMIYYGKILYLKDKLVPFKTKAERMGYSEKELEWAQANEDQIWRYFVEKELLYSSDQQLGPRFLFPAPFSKFYLELDNEAPARLGQYIGWQIVRQYMSKNEVSLKEMLHADEETIFKQSNYKPSK
ncbi:protein involved in gliding motility GldB [Salinimicrobium catena]|uniref:Protein involved in gliding motility GldB n=1 Tax=Salinimicrobium catena TaxID=390640 RepID=A0A1H5P217_9FLAO|nr:gliding motility lipoprotein GldB [Salinimicrobium catena]SDL63663.1 gliding motility-associated lipoprotein GldB [Salinimicrobium catena]SEF07087.1 protein involved in gliding motility GldB [Salinimicrobium catena]